MSRICLVGAGVISRVHAEALRTLPAQTIAAVVDPNLDAARRLAKDFGAAATYGSVAEALAADAFDRAHVLVPPPLHASTAAPILAAGKPVLLEKPLATSSAECATLVQAAGATALGVNQNFVHHPAFARLRRMVESGSLGRPRSVSCLYNVALRQLASRQFGHWMFRAPLNILLEQAVHPLSQLAVLAGDIGAAQAMAGPSVAVGPGLDFYPTLTATLACARLPAQLRFAVGQDFPFWQVSVICDDGVGVADILANRCFAHGRTRWLEMVDGVISGVRTGAAVARDSVRNAADYIASTAKLQGRSDPFFRSMRASIATFHAALDAGRPPPLDGAFGAALVRGCELLAEAAYGAPARGAASARAPGAASARAPGAASARAPGSVSAPATPRPAEPAVRGDIAILGGTGFIGVATVRAFLDAGLAVRVMARGTQNLPALFADPRVTLHRGSIGDPAAVGTATHGARVVVNLAHGGGGADFEAIRAAMVGGAETVARACLAAGARLVHVGSIASLYLGPQPEPITGATAPDPEETKRGDYARAKVLADRMLLEMHAREGLRVVILRPGVVVGEGGPPLHSGLGFFNNDQHCIGWNAGRNPLPFVLVEDVAAAILRAATVEGVEGRAYNIVGDVRLSAREYIAELGRALGRPLVYHPQAATHLWLEDGGKWLIKRATGRKVAAPTRRDFLSRGMAARFDITDAMRDLDWHPVADRERFLDRAVRVHAQ